MTTTIEKKPTGLKNKSKQGNNGVDAKQNGSDKQKKASIKTVNPATNKVVKSFEEMSEQAIDSAISSADKAFQDWKKTSYKQRANLLHKVASLMRKKKDSLAKLITLEMGKLLKESQGEIDLSANIIDYYADNGAKFLADQTLKTEVGEAIVRHSPIGVLLGVEPWNFPFYQVARFAAPNIMIGNVVLVKHASNVPQCGIAIEILFKEAGAPAGLYTNLLIPGSKVSALLTDDRIKGASLTGSENAGASLAEAAGKNLKKSVLELGGSDAFIVLEDANIDKAVEWAVIGRMNNTGQCCVAAKRFIVVEAVADEFLEKFKKSLTGLKVGDPMDKDTKLGPLSSEEAAVHLEDQVNRLVSEGAKVVLGGNRIDRQGAYMEATILTDIKPGMDAYHEELFGPVASFFRVKDEAEAIKLANDSPFGLGGSVFTNDIERGKKVADQIDTGMVFINHPTWTKEDLPFGGTKRSGYGRELSELGIQEFVNKKLIRVSALSDPF
jgi:succinate-semialdehyde dehydrogenase/glutarate-semialdehyde dehydrogenase